MSAGRQGRRKSTLLARPIQGLVLPHRLSVADRKITQRRQIQGPIKGLAISPYVVHHSPNWRRCGALCILKGSVVAAKPKKSVRTSVILPDHAHAHIAALAAANDVSTAWVIRHAVLRFLEEHGGQTELALRAAPRKKVPA